ncbi:tRNA processing endoribonuclease Trz1 [Aspergillus heteromorphus CBS 117.55]|uniref:ribonuclease Z n=1 Tax=Aspergillus heteromorphus CBS 117.55 TaxID=1448321 RepID=A0A317WZ30_9EURO|nr:tRNA processing endoribonuclease Trz1 [Aspergillus heteromorphus CBS 117.55]PWY89988.1 tRNA processing endoribonuclease Trz1 [Aspergillus heteromorphus CBS 117.55]
MKFYYEVVTTPTADTPGTTVLLHFPNKRYFFGHVSEGTQRACSERGLKVTALSDIFITGQVVWKNTGGLIGVILTLADSLASSANAVETSVREKNERRQELEQGPNNSKGVEDEAADGQIAPQRGDLTIHGGRNLAHTLATARRFVFRKGMPLSTREYDTESMSKPGHAEGGDPFEEPTWMDSNIKVWAMPIRPSPAPCSREIRSRSPRKRSLDEFEEREDSSEAVDARTQDQIIRQGIIGDMFNSSWKMDSLHEQDLADVKMPATMFVRNPVTKDLEQYKGPAPGSSEPLPNIKVLVRQPWPGAAVDKIPPTTWCHESLSYIVRNHTIRGKFDPKKAQALKVRRGPDYAKLTKGESVTSEDGNTITPDMVLGPSREGKGMAFIDLPTRAYVDDLVDRPEWSSPSVTSNLETILWILGPGVGDHPRLHEFVAKMPHCEHTVSSPDYCANYLALKSVAETTVRMGILKPDSYHVPVHDNVTVPQPGSAASGTARDMSKAVSLQPVEPGLVIEMEPKFVLNRSEVQPPYDTKTVSSMMPVAVQQRMDAITTRMGRPEFAQKLREFRSGLPGANAEIIALGTGSSAPSKYRNVSATLLSVPGHGYYLLDCGENTLGQLKRVFTPEKLREVLQNLRLIWISHLHADHHLGLASVIRAWFEENYPDGSSEPTEVEMDMSKILQEKRLFVVSEDMMIGWLEEYAGVENYGFGKVVPLTASPFVKNNTIKTEFIYRHCRSDGLYPGHKSAHSRPDITSLSFTDAKSRLTPLLHQATGLSNILTSRVNHCRGAMAVSLVFDDGFKVSFSGDCRPSAGFVSIGQDSTVLIHEATFQDDMAGSAIAKKHSTVSEALEVGRLMKARSIVLTHFSQRYQKVSKTEDASARHNHDDAEPESLEEEPRPRGPNNLFGNITVTRKPRLNVPIVGSFDYMRIRVGDMPISQALSPAVEKLFDLLERVNFAASVKRKEAHKLREKETRDAKKAQNSAARASASASAAAADAAEMDVTEPTESVSEPAHSIWSASESESGWDTGSEHGGERFRRRKMDNYSPWLQRDPSRKLALSRSRSRSANRNGSASRSRSASRRG